MLLHIGNKVRFIHTGVEGKIVDRLDDGLFIVELSEGIEIPASGEHLQRIDAEVSSVKAKIINHSPKATPTPVPPPKTQFQTLKGHGIQLAFELQTGGSMQRYSVYIVNDTLYKAIYEVKIIVKDETKKKTTDVVKPKSVALIMEMPSDYLSDNPRFEINCQQISTEGKTDWLKKELKVKPKNFFSKKKTAPILGRQAHVYPLFAPLELKKKLESLQQYTKQKIAQKIPTPKRTDQYHHWTGHDVKRFANFPLEKDLHIEVLVKDHSRMSNGEILKKQLRVFEEYLEEAIQLGVERVFVIHGKGKGKLKNEIASILMKHPLVKTFKNEYHSKYGTGATEVIFE